MPLTTPQSSAGVLNFYDAPERGPQVNAKVLLVAVAIFVILVLVFDHASLAI